MRIRGILLDLEGVLYQEGAALRFLTNTTTQPRRILVQRLKDLGFWTRERDLFTPAIAAGNSLHHHGLTRIHLAAPRRRACAPIR